jgi:hypothetical protein
LVNPSIACSTAFSSPNAAIPHHFQQPRDLLESVLLLDSVDRSPQTFNLRVLFGSRSSIRLSKLAEFPILRGQLPPQVRNRRLKPDDLSARVPRNEFPSPPPELYEMKIPAEQLKVDWVSILISVAARNNRKYAAEARERA